MTRTTMKKWEILSTDTTSEINRDDKITSLITLLLHNRGIKDQKNIEAFLHPSFAQVTIEDVDIDKKELKKTVSRIKRAIEKKEQIIIFGDYDVDGITASAILWETIHDLGGLVMPYIPSRLEEGYGLSEKGIENVQKMYPKTTLIITVDNGIVANNAVDFANKRKIDVIVTDHHAKSDTLPDAYAFVHTTKLCGAGVAYMLSYALKDNEEEMGGKKDRHLELAALGTIADLVPLTNANRVIVAYGLKKLCKTERKGLIELYKEAACDENSLGVYQVGHIIAPRLNASGRLYSAMDSLRLLCTLRDDKAYDLANKLSLTNKERQTIMREATLHASEAVKKLPSVKKLLFVPHETYPEGVIGLVAGRLVEEFYRPSIVISKGEKLSKASVRSISGFNIIEFLRLASDLLVNVGGHPMAAGFTVETEKLPELQKKLEEMAETLVTDAHLIRSLRIDCELPLSFVTKKLYDQLQALGPFGMGNPEPTFVSKNVEVSDIKILGKEGKHLKLFLSLDHGSGIKNRGIEAIAFGMGEKAAEIKRGDTIDIVYTIDENEWQGVKKIQLKVKDIKLPY